jgi:pimeloyl-ACP methyl ester carboxylesterase
VPEEVTFVAADGIVVFADRYHPPAESDRDGATIILFHQAGGDARGEYASIVPRLLQSGYDVLAVDQRAGGDRFGGVNRTVAELDREYGYCEAYPDLEAALAWAVESGPSDRIAVWGSSYSAALVIRLAVDHPESVDAVLAFSPASGDPMEGCQPDGVLGDLGTPTMALRPDREMEIESVAAQALELERNGVVVVVSEGGVHGSSMLDPERASGDVEPTWQAVLEFLSAHL